MATVTIGYVRDGQRDRMTVSGPDGPLDHRQTASHILDALDGHVPVWAHAETWEDAHALAAHLGCGAGEPDTWEPELVPIPLDGPGVPIPISLDPLEPGLDRAERRRRARAQAKAAEHTHHYVSMTDEQKRQRFGTASITGARLEACGCGAIRTADGD